MAASPGRVLEHGDGWVEGGRPLTTKTFPTVGRGKVYNKTNKGLVRKKEMNTRNPIRY
jgi:hypothetical protein